jgi:hypothetical protein
MSRLAVAAAMISVVVCGLVAPSSQAAVSSPMSSDVRSALSAAEGGTEQPILARFRAGAASRTRVAVGHRGVAASRTRVAVGHRGAVASRTTAVRGPRGNVAVRRTTVAVGGVVRPVRRWVRRPYYGTVVAGVALGTLIAATTIPAAPSPDLCWYWSNSSQSQGYWDYCQPQ